MFMTNPSLNKCMDFNQEYQTIELCAQAGDILQEKMLRSGTVTGIAYKCVETVKP